MVMNKKILHTIINEEINRVLNEDAMDGGKTHGNNIASLINNYFNKHSSKKNKHSSKENKPPKKKVRKTVNGGKEYYDYDDYERENVKVSLSDANSIRNSIDTEKTNMAAIARDLFPDHTEEGAQSQFRKIVNGERPMTKKIASKIAKYISRGKIAVK